MSISLWNIATGVELATLIERSSIDIALPVANGYSDIELELISGTLPKGTRLEGTKLVGTPNEVAIDTVYTCVIRAYWMGNFDDRTIKFVVTGPDEPKWKTPAGLLPVGNNNNTYFILDNEIIDFQLLADDEDLPAGDVLDYFIADGDGALPPGIQLTRDGRLYGTTEPLLSLDKRFQYGGYDNQTYGDFPFDYSVLSANGYSTFYYDTQTYDYSEFTQSPRKLNRYYPFAVTVTDGNTFARREFKIYVVGDDYLRADNTIMQASTGVFTADNTHLRTPRWITPRDLGFKRANNYTTIYLDVIDNDMLVGTVTYTLENLNDDGSISELPPGLTLDSRNGEIVGRLPYQPAITENYMFTVKATRVEGDYENVNVYGTFYEDVLLGKNSFKIYKVDLTTSADGVADLHDLIGREILLNDSTYTVLNVNDNNADYDVIYLNDTLGPKISLILSKTAAVNDEYIFVSRLTDPEKQQYQGHSLNFSASEQYKITTIEPYLEYEVEHANLSFTKEELDAEFDCDSYIEVLEEGRWRIRLQSTSYTRIISKIKEFVTPDSNLAKVTLIRDNEDRIKLDNVLLSQLNQGRNIGIALFKNDFFKENFVIISTDETVEPSSKKTFELKVIGEIDSTITWLTDSYLGSIKANYISTLKVEATTTVPDSYMVYTIVDGKLPNGMYLNHYGELINSARQYATVDGLGLTTFDSKNTTFDGNTGTSFDRQFKFTIEARDRFGLSASTKEFVLDVLDLDDTRYTNIVARPLLPQEQRDLYINLTGDSTIFTPSSIYRPDDNNFGIQQRMEMLIYAGIEATDIEQFVAAAAKNHKRKKYRLGEVTKAIAREPGTTETIYEVVYIPVIDPAMPTSGKTRKSFNIKTNNIITADSVQYSVKDDLTKQGSGYPALPIYGREIVKFIFADNQQNLIIEVRNNDTYSINVDNNDFIVDIRDTQDLSVQLTLTDSEPRRIRPNTNTIKADSNAVKVSNSKDQIRYISNIDNMRDNISQIGKNQREYLPLWMRTPQNGLQELNYVSAIPLCFCKPGTADDIIANIKYSGFDFKQLNVDIDRYIVRNSKDNENEQFILFANYQFNV